VQRPGNTSIEAFPRRTIAAVHAASAQEREIDAVNKTVLLVAAVGEMATGAALLLAPALVGQLLLGAELSGLAIIVARVTGIALVALGVACWPGTPMLAMLVYSAAITVFLAYVGLAASARGVLLWPVVVLHAIMSVLLARSWLATRRPPPVH
jgi:hypothetical protein